MDFTSHYGSPDCDRAWECTHLCPGCGTWTHDSATEDCDQGFLCNEPCPEHEEFTEDEV
jgi:hypothetical protein